MKTNRTLNLLVLGLAGSLSVGVFHARSELEVSAAVSIQATADFDAPLTTCGSWVEVGTYGRCWRPTGVVVGWRPYCEGHWEWTDCGWYWVSDEPWAWACYHYGYWAYDAVYGWVWIPGIEWGPAWVSWRFGGGYIGWAPLAPRHAAVVSAHFVFVENRSFCDRVRPSTVIVNNTTIINKTTVIEGTRRESRDFGTSGKRTVVVNEGPGVAVVEKASGRKLKVASVQEVDGRTAVPDQVRGRGKAMERQNAEPAKSSVEPAPKAKANPNPAPAPEPRRNGVPDTDKQRPPGGERETIKPSPPGQEKLVPPVRGRRSPGTDWRGHGGVGPQPLPPQPQRPPAAPSLPPADREKGGDHGKKDKHERD